MANHHGQPAMAKKARRPHQIKETIMGGMKNLLIEMEEAMQEKLDNEACWVFPTEADYCSTETDTPLEIPVNQNEAPFPNSDIGEEPPTKSND